MIDASESVVWLFVPGTQYARFAKAVAAGPDQVIIDLEDAVPPTAKEEARGHVVDWLDDAGSAWVRVNDVRSPWFADDVTALMSRPGLRGFVLPKTESADDLAELRRLAGGLPAIALVESAAGVERLPEIARSPSVARLAFGSIDLALDLGCSPDSPLMSVVQSQIVVTSRAASLPSPIDGVSTAIDDPDAVLGEATQACAMGFGAKLAIHPRQVDPIRRGFQPSPAELEWARAILASDPAEPSSVGGHMVDAPVIKRAHGIMARASGQHPS